jgi:membrane protein DedA with SNARE-associated domain
VAKKFTRKKIILTIQVVIVFLIYSLTLIYIRRHIPEAPQLVQRIEGFYGQYGYDMIFLGALLEGTFMVGFYVPGSFIVLLGAVLAKSGIVSFPFVILFGTLGLLLGYIINFMLGRFGWYHIVEGVGLGKSIKSAEDTINKHQKYALFWGYMMPSTASFLSTAAGILRVDFKKFLLQSLLTQLFWSLLWGGLAYVFGMPFVELFLAYFGFLALIGFLLFIVKKLKWK